LLNTRVLRGKDGQRGDALSENKAGISPAPSRKRKTPRKEALFPAAALPLGSPDFKVCPYLFPLFPLFPQKGRIRKKLGRFGENCIWFLWQRMIKLFIGYSESAGTKQKTTSFFSV